MRPRPRHGSGSSGEHTRGRCHRARRCGGCRRIRFSRFRRVRVVHVVLYMCQQSRSPCKRMRRPAPLTHHRPTVSSHPGSPGSPTPAPAPAPALAPQIGIGGKINRHPARRWSAAGWPRLPALTTGAPLRSPSAGRRARPPPRRRSPRGFMPCCWAAAPRIPGTTRTPTPSPPTVASSLKSPTRTARGRAGCESCPVPKHPTCTGSKASCALLMPLQVLDDAVPVLMSMLLVLVPSSIRAFVLVRAPDDVDPQAATRSRRGRCGRGVGGRRGRPAGAVFNRAA